MTRFILLTFGFLGWSFYELSGGADYEARADRDPIFAPVVARSATQPADIVPVLSTRSEPATPDTSLVQKASLTVPAAAVSNDTQTSKIAPAVAETRVSVKLDVPETTPEEPKDLRQISGNRVNMRGGPGTGYSVLAKLTKGTDVEVIGGNDAGWLKLRVVETGQVGWMADWLVTAAAE